MKSNFKRLPGSKIELEVALDQAEFKSYFDAVYEHALANVNLKGFRPGAAPKELAEKALDQDKIFEEAAQSAVRHSLNGLSEENNWTLVDKPQVELLPAGDLGLKYKAALTVFPEVKLGNYQKIAKKILSGKAVAKVQPEEIEKSLEWLRNSRAKITRVEREARKGDMVDIDAESAADNFKGDRFILGEGKFLQGFEEKLENHKAGELVEFSLTPPADYWNEKLRGQVQNFKVKINGVFERQLPELSDSFAQGLGPNFKTLEDARTSIREGLGQEKEAKENERLKIKILDEIIKSAQIDLPEIMIQKTLDSMIADYKPMMEKMGKSEEDLRKQLYERAKQHAAANLVIYKIAEEQSLQPSKEEVEKELEQMSAKTGKKVDAEQFYNYSYGVVQNRKVFEFLESQK